MLERQQKSIGEVVASFDEGQRSYNIGMMQMVKPAKLLSKRLLRVVDNAPGRRRLDAKQLAADGIDHGVAKAVAATAQTVGDGKLVTNSRNLLDPKPNTWESSRRCQKLCRILAGNLRCALSHLLSSPAKEPCLGSTP